MEIGPNARGAAIWNPNLILNFPDQLKDAVADWPAFSARWQVRRDKQEVAP